jgi:hypothetical protein
MDDITEPLKDRVWDAIQTALAAWAAYELFVRIMRRSRK